MKQVLKEPLPVRTAWTKAFVKELNGLVYTQQAVAIDDPSDDDEVVPVKEIFKCKLDKTGQIDKLKCRIVFRGDLYDPKDPMDSWNPHANWMSLRTYCALCAKFRVYPTQTDFVMAYLQVKMRERVFVKFPDYWAEHVPENLRKYCGRPLRLLRALYGYTYSGKFLFEEQAEFFTRFGLRQTVIPAMWVMYDSNNAILLILHYLDDLLAASNSEKFHRDFITALKDRFHVEHQPRASWYLQSRIRQDRHGNIYLDQERFSKAVVN
jgi:Reverse transcriptase (RNA-dependent DNA polymerase)